ncbi:hypothetical protein [Nocardia arthritidis]|uniref:Uncharacterized protein n=1 Tax=Nocardia arthritidis TaxID=228602 RepID=A0A6G9Y838_9NOCA|nr:hypothetical protein [Nocardia arthritidis]QIS09382.1 hypothetical protein F5544_07380 [Nocardia arthritidis]
MAYLSTFVDCGDAGVGVDYVPAFRTPTGVFQPAVVTIQVIGAMVHLGLDITEARQLAVTLQDIVMRHDCAVRLASSSAAATEADRVG